MTYLINFICLTIATTAVYQWRVEKARRLQAESIVALFAKTSELAANYMREIR